MINNLYEIDKILGNIIVEQSELDRNNIKNGLGIRGSDLSKFINENIYISPNIKDTIIIFNTELEDNPITEEKENEIVIDNFLNFKLMIYGAHSKNLAYILKARLESEEVRYELTSKYINLINIDNVISVDDIINNTIYPRCDLNIHLHIISKSVKKINSFENYENLGNIEILNILK